MLEASTHRWSLPATPTPSAQAFSPTPADLSARNSYVAAISLEPSQSDLHAAPSTVAPVDKEATGLATGPEGTAHTRRRWPLLVFIGAVAAIIIALAIALPVALVHKHNHDAAISSGSTVTGNGDPNSPSPNPASPAGTVGGATGADGSLIVMEDGTNFTYRNQFGGFCEYSLQLRAAC